MVSISGEDRGRGYRAHLQKAENVPNLGKELDIHVHKAKRTPDYLKAKRPSPRHILNLSNVNDKEP